MEVVELLRGRPVMAGPLPGFEVESAPDGPGELFVRWLAEAVASGVTEPQVVTLSTADARGRPSSRVLMLRDVDVAEAGWVFASSAASRKGAELSENPWAALCAYWPERGRQVRVGGPVTAGSPEESAAEFLARPRESRLAGLTGRQSSPLPGREAFEAARREAAELLDRHPEALPADYTVYTLRADEVEFWQGDAGVERHHVRLRYLRGKGGWTKQLLWP